MVVAVMFVSDQMKVSMKYLIYVCLSFLLTGCGTPYTKVSALSANGYSESILDDRRAIVNFVSYRGDRDSAVINGAMLRAAELAKEKRFFGFRVVKDSAGSESSAMSMGGSFNAYQVGNQTFGSMNSMPLILSRSQYSINIYFLNKDEFMPGDFESQQLISNLKSKF
jgi:hypothetical protein